MPIKAGGFASNGTAAAAAAGALISPLLINKPILLAAFLLLVSSLIYLKQLQLILYVVIIVAFTRTDAWLSFASGIPFGTIVVGLILLSFALILSFTNWELNAPNQPVIQLLLFYIFAAMIGILFGDRRYFNDWARDSLYAFLSFFSVYLLVSDERLLRSAMKTVIVCGIVLSLTNLAELLFPNTIKLSHSMGRAAGLLKNSNASAFAIICSYILYNLHIAHSKIANKILIRLLLQSIFFMGVLSTFSREGVLLLGVVFIINNFIDTQNKVSVSLNYISLIITVTICVFITKYMIESNSRIFLLSFNKLYSFLHGNLDDNHRIFLLKYYLSRAAIHPLTGFGLYATIRPSWANADLLSRFGVLGPHNTAAAVFVETGLISLFLYFMFYWSLLISIRRIQDTRARQILTLLWGCLVFHNNFAHDILVTRYIMVLLGLISAFTAVYKKNVNSILMPGKFV